MADNNDMKKVADKIEEARKDSANAKAQVAKGEAEMAKIQDKIAETAKEQAKEEADEVKSKLDYLI